MKTFQLKTLAVLAAFTFMTACQKDEETKNQVTITIDKPNDAQNIASGDTVFIKGSIVGTEELHGYSIVLRQLSDSSVVYEMDEHAHDTQIQFDKFWVNNVPATENMRLEITAIIDHEGNTQTEQRSFVCNQ